jgi:two-component system, OmpR family, response regulator
MQPARILIVHHGTAARRAVVDYLAERGLDAVSAVGEQEVARHFLGTVPNLIVLDVTEDAGCNLLRSIRSHSTVPIIVANQHECDERARVAALDLGADDYLTVPLALRELLARIRAILRRACVALLPGKARMQSGYRFGGWRLELRNSTLTDPRGKLVRLTKHEYAMLLALLESPHQPLTREQLMHATRVHEDVFDRSIDVQILRLRRKLETDAKPHIIKTERGVGYFIDLPVESECGWAPSDGPLEPRAMFEPVTL